MEVRGAAEPSAVKKEDEPFQVFTMYTLLVLQFSTCIPVACT